MCVYVTPQMYGVAQVISKLKPNYTNRILPHVLNERGIVYRWSKKFHLWREGGGIQAHVHTIGGDIQNQHSDSQIEICPCRAAQ